MSFLDRPDIIIKMIGCFWKLRASNLTGLRRTKDVDLPKLAVWAITHRL